MTSPTTSRSGEDAGPDAAAGHNPVVVFPLSGVIRSGVGVALVAAGAGGGVMLLLRPSIGAAGAGWSALTGLAAGLVGLGVGLGCVKVWLPRPVRSWTTSLMVAQAVSLAGVAVASILLYSALRSAGLNPLGVALSATGVFVGLQVVVAKWFGRAVSEAVRPGAG